MIPHHTNKHYTLYVVNKFRDSIDILDSLNYVNYVICLGVNTTSIEKNWYVLCVHLFPLFLMIV